jgi:hypothetical protein
MPFSDAMIGNRGAGIVMRLRAATRFDQDQAGPRNALGSILFPPSARSTANGSRVVAVALRLFGVC